MRLSDYFGPSTLVTAAFIGPGTITLCSIAGVETGYSLLWALVFSTFATIVLQEMAARLGFKTQEGIPEAIHKLITSTWIKNLVLAIIFSAIIIGNAAYEAGNISGASLGLDLILGSNKFWPLAIGSMTFILLWLDKYKWIETILIALVLTMSVAFMITAFLVKPDINALLSGLKPTEIQKKDLLLIMGLIGTTVVPYNLFLHASIVSKKHSDQGALRKLRIENAISIGLGGLISILIVIAAAGARASVNTISSAADLAIQLEPFVGKLSKQLMGLGLSAAGLSSTITAAIAAALVAKGLFQSSSTKLYRIVWLTILVSGLAVSLTGINTIVLIKFAQITNAIILPVVACFLIYICNSKQLMGQLSNTLFQNLLAIVVIVVTLLISIRSFILIF